MNGGGRVDSGGSCSPKASPRQATGEGGRSRAEASRPQAGLGIGDFAVMGKLGEGGYGTVLLARHKTTNLMYALKMQLKARIQSDTQADRVLSEAQALHEVQHPFIVSMLGAFQNHSHIFFALEYVGGGDLWTRLHTDGPMKEEPGRVVLAEVALALAHVHKRGYMYRDLKPENVLVCIDGHVKLADFGLAVKFSDKREQQLAETPSGSRSTYRHSRMVGTPDTLAPEVMGINAALDADGDYGASVDYWGLGILTCEVFVGLETSALRASGASEAGRCALYVLYESEGHVSQETLDQMPQLAAKFASDLLVVDVSRRLGCRHGIAEIQAHPLLASLDFSELLLRHVPPPLPRETLEKGNTSPGGRRTSRGSHRSLVKLEQNLVEFLNTPATSFLSAAESGDLGKLREQVVAGIEPGICERDGTTALHVAARRGLLEVARFLIEELAADHSPIDQWKTTPLDAAWDEGHEDMRIYLEDKGAKRCKGMLLTGVDKESDLCDAAARGDLERLRSLTAPGGVPVNQGDYDQRTALHLAASEGLLETVKFLVLEAGARVDVVDRWGGTPLDDAIRHGHYQVFTFLLGHGAKTGRTSSGMRVEQQGELETDGETNDNASTRLCDAASRGDRDKLMYLANGLGLDVDLGDYDKRTAIHLAASEGKLDVVKCLILELKANPSPVDRWGGTPLDDALRQGHAETAAFLRGQGAKRGRRLQQQSKACVLL